MRRKFTIDEKDSAFYTTVTLSVCFSLRLAYWKGDREVKTGAVGNREEKTQGNNVRNTWESEKLALSAVLPNTCVAVLLFSLVNVDVIICKMQKLIQSPVIICFNTVIYMSSLL